METTLKTMLAIAHAVRVKTVDGLSLGLGKLARLLVVALLALSTTAHADAADEVRVALVRAFAAKDMKAVDRLVVDPYSGLRFCKTWDDASWKRTARALESATRTGSKRSERVYRVLLNDRERSVSILDMNGEWKLDLSSLLGPFPHF